MFIKQSTIYYLYYKMQEVEKIVANEDSDDSTREWSPALKLVYYFARKVKEEIRERTYCPYFNIGGLQYICYAPDVNLFFWYDMRFKDWSISKAYMTEFLGHEALHERIFKYSHINMRKEDKDGFCIEEQ